MANVSNWSGQQVIQRMVAAFHSLHEQLRLKIPKKLRTIRLGQNLLVLLKKKSVYTIRDCRTALSSDVCTVGIITTTCNVYTASFNKREINRPKIKPHQVTQNNTKGERYPDNRGFPGTQKMERKKNPLKKSYQNHVEYARYVVQEFGLDTLVKLVV